MMQQEQDEIESFQRGSPPFNKGKPGSYPTTDIYRCPGCGSAPYYFGLQQNGNWRCRKCSCVFR
jgi:hypothetical protein